MRDALTAGRVSPPPACMPPQYHTMPPIPSSPELSELVRKLGVVTRPRELKEALTAVAKLCSDVNNKAAIVVAGAIPPLVQLLGTMPGFPYVVQQRAAAASLMHLSHRDILIDEETAVTIAAAGAIPQLVQLLESGSPAYVQQEAVGVLALLAAANTEIAVTIVEAGAIAPLVQLLGSGSPVLLQKRAVDTLVVLAMTDAAFAATIAAAGAIPLLLQLLGPGYSAQVQATAR
jgi:hypothetical protein